MRSDGGGKSRAGVSRRNLRKSIGEYQSCSRTTDSPLAGFAVLEYIAVTPRPSPGNAGRVVLSTSARTRARVTLGAGGGLS